MKRKAFTLVEVLVVIAVIALLVMILMPSYQQAAAMTRATLCRNNLAKLSTAFATHASGASARTLKGTFSLPTADLWPGVPFSVCPVKTVFICPEKEEKSSYSMPTNPLEGLVYVNKNPVTCEAFSIDFRETGVPGVMHFGTRRGRDSRGDYIEVGTDDNEVVTAAYMNNDGHDGLMRIYLLSTGEVIIKLMQYSCGESNCILYHGKPLFPDNVHTNPTDQYYGWMGPGTSKVGQEVMLSRGMQCSYGINERSGELHYGDSRVLLVDYDKVIVDLSNAECPKLLSTAAQRHLGKLNMLLTDGAVRPTGPTQLDPLLGGMELWEP
jgi:prepilin-type N-terminal cleavage/methylation domain-containing protein